jgi:acetyltransferase-like isoleucine patch superfamily enzyme
LFLSERIGSLLAFPLFVAWRLKLVGYDTAGQLLSLIPGAGGVLVRRGWYRRTLARCGERLSVEFGAVIHRPDSRFGDDCYVGAFGRIGLVDVGDDFLAADHVSILSGHNHYGIDRRDLPMRLQPGRHERVSIGRDVWIGDGAVVSADIAAHSVVGSGAVVTKTFDEWQILAGVPARPIGTRSYQGGGGAGINPLA